MKCGRDRDRLASSDQATSTAKLAAKSTTPGGGKRPATTQCRPSSLPLAAASDQQRYSVAQVHYPWQRGWQSSDPVGHRGHDVTIPAPSLVQAGQYLPGRGPGTEREPGIPARGTDYLLRHLGQFPLGFYLLASDLGSCGLNGKRGLSLLACLLNSRDHLAQAVYEELHLCELTGREYRG